MKVLEEFDREEEEEEISYVLRKPRISVVFIRDLMSARRVDASLRASVLELMKSLIIPGNVVI